MNDGLVLEAQRFVKEYYVDQNLEDVTINMHNITYHEAKLEMVKLENGKNIATYETIHTGDKVFLSVYYPYNTDEKAYIKLTYDATYIYMLLNRILFSILLVNCSMIVIIVFYALFLSRVLLLPIKSLNYKLANMNESFLKRVDMRSFPEEFIPLGKSVNKLISKIQNFVSYQKEFFIGIAHELKTPLAVMKTKNEVTLLKERDKDVYTETIKKNISQIDEMNKMITAILEIGRQEGAQFEDSVRVDLIKFINDKIDGFRAILADKESKKRIVVRLTPKTYKITIQTTLVVHILQNFIQNAFKFTKDGSEVIIRSYVIENGFFIEVLDESGGIDESRDFFAPFKRFGNKSGVGLGLFLAKNAADAIGATLSLKNRTDGVKGTIATLFIPNQQKSDKTLF
jgi:two-component system OmpR family sensor kinase